MTRGVILAAPASGSGKTVITLALLHHLHKAGLPVTAAKAGPDYIDAGLLAAAAGTCRNLDVWAMRRDTIAASVAALDGLVLCEGAMGLFDGIGSAGLGSTAALASLVGWPVVLVVDASGQGASLAALVKGFAHHRAATPLAGVILNRVGSPRHRVLLEAALAADVPHLARLGAVPRHDALALPSRHLGLVPAGEHAALDAFLDRAAAIVAASVDVAGLVALAAPATLAPQAAARPLPPLGQRIAVARDAAFAFTYPAMLDGWRADGATVAFFSPLGDEAPAADADAVFLPGGYPELHAGRLAAASRFRAALQAHAARGTVIYGECGGYMTLGKGLVDADGARHAMLGLLPLETDFASRRLALGYRTAMLAASGPLGDAGTRFRAHEFHYATIV
ncbi:MAG TPA: cobyrinate a,c-diamide synthase, partial [Stellaceae bacterium]|nr:cobyrinate a,c-diamide synthase [Stellaceae bacterium]